MVVHLFLNNNKALDFLPINSIKNGGITTEALTNLLALENVAQIEASIRKGCISATHFISSDGKYIYDIGINDMENQLRIEDFRALYPETWWTIDCVIES